MLSKSPLILLFFSALFSFPKASSENLWEEPWPSLQSSFPSEKKAKPTSLPLLISEKVILFHQKILSPVDGPRSHFRPTSSSYMLSAMRKHGFWKGYLMGCDRLIRENDDPWVYRTKIIDGVVYKWDPPP